MIGTMKCTVHAGWENDRPIGILTIEKSRGKDMVSFDFSEEWLSNRGNLLLDPFLQPWPGRQFAEHGLWGCFSDAAPDRWGRMLMKRRELELAEREDRISQNLTDSDYLLGVEDILRTGDSGFRKMDDFWQKALWPSHPWQDSGLWKIHPVPLKPVATS